MAVLFLKFLGGFGARLSSGEPAVIPIRKGQALLAYIALNRGEAILRSRLCGLLWGDHGDEQARSSLRQTLTVLRKALGPMQDQILRADRQSISLDDVGVEVDALTFQDLIARGTPADLEAAVPLYRGDLLDGLDLSDPGFQAWLEEERRRFHGLMVGALHALMAHKRAAGAREDAIVLAERLLVLDPLREDVHRALMVLHAELGQRQAALRQYERCRSLLAAELDVEPEPETEALSKALRSNGAATGRLAGVSGAFVASRRETGDGAKPALDDRSGPPSIGTTAVSRAPRRWARIASRTFMAGGIAVLAWLLAWGYPAVQLPPDLLDSLEIDALSSGDLAGALDGVSESSGPARQERLASALRADASLDTSGSDGLSGVLDRVSTLRGPAGHYRRASSPPAEPSLLVASIDDRPFVLDGVSGSSEPARAGRIPPPRPVEPSRAMASFGDLAGVLAHVADHSGSTVLAATGAGDAERSGAPDARLAMQQEADVLWAGLAESWDLPAVRAFRTRFPDAGQADDADRRIAFLIRHQRDAQAELNRLGYNAGPVDGVWGSRSARAMRSFQSDHGLTPDGVLSEVLLDRLTTGGPKRAAPTPSLPAQQPDGAVPEVTLASLPTGDGIPQGSRWTASGKSREGSRVFATATRQGDALEIVFDVNHKGVSYFGPPHADRYSQSCTVPLSAPVIECWIAERRQLSFGAKVFGTFPRLTYEMQLALGWKSGPLPGDIVLEFLPELKSAGPTIAAPTTAMLEAQPLQARHGPEDAVSPPPPPAEVSIPDGSLWNASGRSPDGSRIFATATRHGDALEIVFDVDHRDNPWVSPGRLYVVNYTQSCAASAADRDFECWIPTKRKFSRGAHVSGTFPRFTYEMMMDPQNHDGGIGNVVLEFHPELRVAAK